MDGSTKEKLRVEGNQVMMLNIIVTQKRKDYSEIIKFINTWRRKLEDDSSMQNSKQYANLNDVITDIRKKDAIIKRWQGGMSVTYKVAQEVNARKKHSKSNHHSTNTNLKSNHK